MLKITVDIEPISKPRGGVSKHGKIYHSTPQYTSWKRRFKREILSLGLSPGIFDGMYSIVFHIHWRIKPGQIPDGDNMQGAIQDVFVKDLKFLPDDNIKYIDDWRGKAYMGTEEKIVLFICYTKEDLIRVITDYE